MAKKKPIDCIQPIDDAIEQQEAELLELQALLENLETLEAARPEVAPVSGEFTLLQLMERLPKIQLVPVSEIKVDPDRFQFKKVTGKLKKEGVEEPLSGKSWRGAMEALIGWQSKQGSIYVVEGHHRVQLAKRLKIKNLPFHVLEEREGDEIHQGISAEVARAVGAMSNIQQDHGTISDYIAVISENLIPPEEIDEVLPLDASENTKKGRARILAVEAPPEVRDSLKDTRQRTINESQAIGITKGLRAHDEATKKGAVEWALKRVRANPDIAGENIGAMVAAFAGARAAAGGGEEETQLDMFGYDDSAGQSIEQQAKAVIELRREFRNIKKFTRWSDPKAAAALEKFSRGTLSVTDMEAMGLENESSTDILARLMSDTWARDPEILAMVMKQAGQEPAEPVAAAETETETSVGVQAEEGEPGHQPIGDDWYLRPTEEVVRTALNNMVSFFRGVDSDLEGGVTLWQDLRDGREPRPAVGTGEAPPSMPVGMHEPGIGVVGEKFGYPSSQWNLIDELGIPLKLTSGVYAKPILRNATDASRIRMWEVVRTLFEAVPLDILDLSGEEAVEAIEAAVPRGVELVAAYLPPSDALYIVNLEGGKEEAAEFIKEHHSTHGGEQNIPNNTNAVIGIRGNSTVLNGELLGVATGGPPTGSWGVGDRKKDLQGWLFEVTRVAVRDVPEAKNAASQLMARMIQVAKERRRTLITYQEVTQAGTMYKALTERKPKKRERPSDAYAMMAVDRRRRGARKKGAKPGPDMILWVAGGPALDPPSPNDDPEEFPPLTEDFRIPAGPKGLPGYKLKHRPELLEGLPEVAGAAEPVAAAVPEPVSGPKMVPVMQGGPKEMSAAEKAAGLERRLKAATKDREALDERAIGFAGDYKRLTLKVDEAADQLRENMHLVSAEEDAAEEATEEARIEALPEESAAPEGFVQPEILPYIPEAVGSKEKKKKIEKRTTEDVNELLFGDDEDPDCL